MAATPERLSAEILVGDERGSGLLIAKGLVLTALHNLLGDAPSKRVERPLTAKVRFHGDVQDIADLLPPLRDAKDSARRLKALGLPWHEAKLVWPLTEKLADAYDLALLQLDDPDATSLEPLDFVREHVLQNRPIVCVAHGYPTFGMEEYEVADIWELRKVDGELEPTARLSDRMRRILVHSAPPEKLNDWRGLSRRVRLDRRRGSGRTGRDRRSPNRQARAQQRDQMLSDQQKSGPGILAAFRNKAADRGKDGRDREAALRASRRQFLPVRPAAGDEQFARLAEGRPARGTAHPAAQGASGAALDPAAQGTSLRPARGMRGAVRRVARGRGLSRPERRLPDADPAQMRFRRRPGADTVR